MEKRIGAALILVEDKEFVEKLNQIISSHAHIILGRQGLPVREKNISIISLVLEGTTDQIGALTGQLGRLKGIQVKSVLTKPGTRHA
ncbi:MAG TPA: TM1266 family iron-only hydrogenase system putative regulator [Bacteroidales bacterium]|nr:TM1266 family iron-only hydrogenase system putative regulator [Bacteroidales bacterium]